MLEKKTIYFPNLNALRFIAAFIVIIHHIEQTKFQYGLPNLWRNQTILQMGKTGVILFFVLSGFLITYLLLSENKETGKISIKKFYVRRILRIWPLYYIILIIVFFILPHLINSAPFTDFGPRLTAFMLISANVALAVFGATYGGTHLWSVSSEEHFYLIWPLLIRTIPNKIVLFISVIFIYIIIKIICAHFFDELSPIRTYLHHFCIDCMAIGGLFAYLLHEKSRLLKFLFNKYLFYIAVLISISMILKGIYIPSFQYEVFALLFAIIIINLAANKSYENLLENGILKYLGKISYGLYMYHPIIIILCIYGLKKYSITSDFIIYSLSIIGTIFISALSFELIESKILNFKRRFMIIKT